jgi:hypothetical protein
MHHSTSRETFSTGTKDSNILNLYYNGERTMGDTLYDAVTNSRFNNAGKLPIFALARLFIVIKIANL